MLCLHTCRCVFRRWCVHMFVCRKYMVVIKEGRLTSAMADLQEVRVRERAQEFKLQYFILIRYN